MLKKPSVLRAVFCLSGKAVNLDRLKEVDNTLFEGKLIRIARAPRAKLSLIIDYAHGRRTVL